MTFQALWFRRIESWMSGVFEGTALLRTLLGGSGERHNGSDCAASSRRGVPSGTGTNGRDRDARKRACGCAGLVQPAQEKSENMCNIFLTPTGAPSSWLRAHWRSAKFLRGWGRQLGTKRDNPAASSGVHSAHPSFPCLRWGFAREQSPSSADQKNDAAVSENIS